MIYRKKVRFILTLIFLSIVIIEPETAKVATRDGINLCLNTVLPGILIFLIIGSMSSDDILGFSAPRFEAVLGIPKGMCGFFLIGQLCGYPVGAKLLQEVSNRHAAVKKDAMRMINFCNNASPAFIIGIIGPIFGNYRIGILMWIIQIASSFILAFIMKKQSTAHITNTPGRPRRQLIGDVIKTAAVICGWIILFKIFLSYLDLLLLNSIPPLSKTLLWGSIEITNGLLRLKETNSQALCFVVSSFFLSFGGICVILQTRSVAPDLPLREYILSRLIHSGISCTLTSVLSWILFSKTRIILANTVLFAAATAICCLVLYFNQNNGSIYRKNVV